MVFEFDRIETIEEIEHARDAKGIEDLKAAAFVNDQSGSLENAEVLGNGRDIDPDHFCQIADVLFTTREHVDEKKPRRVRQRLENLRLGLVLLGRQLL